LDNNQQHIEEIIREKFEQFAPVPPPNVWDGIEKGLVPVKPSFIGSYGRQIAAAAVLLIAIFGAVWFFTPSGETASELEEAIPETTLLDELETNDLKDSPDQISIEEEEPIIESESITAATEEQTDEATEQKIEGISVEQVVVLPAETVKTEAETETSAQYSVRNDDVSLSYLETKSIHFETFTESSLIEPTIDFQEIPKQESPSKKGSWSAGLYFSPEVILNDFDSVEILPTYSFNFEPTYYINKHWFLRFGVGMSVSRDRGFAKVDYISNDYMGSYDDVYEIKFDSINGEPVPTYFTESIEVWDSIPHISINQITNKYLYVQMPMLFGYHNNNHKFLRWYFYGGPAINFLVYKNIDEPSEGYEGADIIDVENKLPERSPYYMQLWFGGGVDIQATKKLSIALEPSYRYYFNHVFKDDPYKTSLSGFTFRIGLVYKINQK